MAFWPVHPHVCGVYECISCKGTGSIGSSPRMWGLPWLRCSSSRSVSVHPHVCGVYAGGRRAQRRCWRFIPTYVGFTGVFDPYIGCVTVHPHVCGVYELQLIKDNRKDGSSPRMWGLLVVPGFHRAFGRFIPTYVGFTHLLPPLAAFISVHPHVCGVYGPANSSASASTGSSPRMWGLRIRGAQPGRAPRFIPTYVGFTSG